MLNSALENPVFLVGAERSGTTLLRLMLDHHPDIAFNLESEYFVSQIGADGAFPEPARFHRWLREDRVFRHSAFNIDESLDFPDLLKYFLHQKVGSDSKTVVGATIHYGFRKLKYIWPDARYIYLCRDPRDVAASVCQMGWAGNVWVAANWWLEAEAEWADTKRAISVNQRLEVYYEELVSEPIATLNKICEFMGVTFSENMFDYVGASSYSYPDPTLAYKWRDTMAPFDIALVESKVLARMTDRGYLQSDIEVRSVGKAAAVKLAVHSKFVVIATKISRYGFPIYMAELLTRRFGLVGWNAKVKRKIDAMIDAQLR